MAEATRRNSIQNDDDVDAKWNEAITIILKTAGEKIGRIKRRRNHEWFDEECKQIIEQKNEA